MKIGTIELSDMDTIKGYAEKLPTSEVLENSGSDIQKFLIVDFDEKIKNIQEKKKLELTDVKDIINLHIYKDIQVKLKEFQKKVSAKRFAEKEQKINNSFLQSICKRADTFLAPEGKYGQNAQALTVKLDKEYKSLEEACNKAQEEQNLIQELFAKDSNYEDLSQGRERVEKVAKTFCLQGYRNGLCILAMLDLCKEQEKLSLGESPSYYLAEHQEMLKLLTLLVTLPKIGCELQTNLDPNKWTPYLIEKFSSNSEYSQNFSHFCISEISKVQKNPLYDNLTYQDIKEPLKGLCYNALLIQSLDVRGNDLTTDAIQQIIKGKLNAILSIPKELFPALPPALPNSKKTLVEHENFQKLFKLFENDPKKYWDHFKQKTPLNKLFTQVSYLCDDMAQLGLLVKGAENFKNLEKDLSEPEVVFLSDDGLEAFTSLTELPQGGVSTVVGKIREKYSAIEKKVEALKKLKKKGKATFLNFKGEDVEIDIIGLKGILESQDSENLNSEEGFLSTLDNLINIKEVAGELYSLKEKAQKSGVNFDVESGLAEAIEDNTLKTLVRQGSSGYESGNSSGSSTPELSLPISEGSTEVSSEALKPIDSTTNDEVELGGGSLNNLIDKDSNLTYQRSFLEVVITAPGSQKQRKHINSEGNTVYTDTVVNISNNPLQLMIHRQVKNLRLLRSMNYKVITIQRKYHRVDRDYSLLDSNQTELKQPYTSTDGSNQGVSKSDIEKKDITAVTHDEITVIEGDTNKTDSETITTPRKGNKMWYALALPPVVLLAALVIAKVALSTTSFFGENLLKNLPSFGMNNPVINKENIFIFLPIAVFLTLITCAAIYCAQREKPGSSLCGSGGKSVNEGLQH